MTIAIHDSHSLTRSLALLNRGECFRHLGRIFQLVSDRSVSMSSRIANRLDDGTTVDFPFDTMVEPVHLEVTVCRPRDE